MIDKIKNLLDLNNSFYTFCKKIGWVFLLNFLFILTSIPVVTIGASATAMYTVLNKMIEERDFRFFGDYFRSFKENFLCSTVMWLIMAVILLVLFLDVQYVFGVMTGAFAYAMRVGTVLLLVLFCMTANAVFPLIARFDVKVKEVIPTILSMIFEHFFLSLEGVLFTAAIFGGCLWIVLTGWFWGLFVLLPFLSFGLHAFMQSYLYKKIFSFYIEEEETDPDYVTEYREDE